MKKVLKALLKVRKSLVVALVAVSVGAAYFVYGDYHIKQLKGNGWTADLRNGKCDLPVAKFYAMMSGIPIDVVKKMKKGTITDKKGNSSKMCYAKIEGYPPNNDTFIVSEEGQMGVFEENDSKGDTKTRIEDGPARPGELRI